MSDSEDEVADRQFKMVLIGDPQVGKTSMVTRYAKEMFTKQYAPTVGVEFYLKRAVLPGPRSVSLKMWDVGGSAIGAQGGGRMLDKYLYGADAVVLVYDVSNYDSFENLQEWLSACKAVLQGSNSKARAGYLPSVRPISG